MQVILDEKINDNKLQNRISVFDFTNYREFLSAYYHDQKQKNPFFSFRYFALKAKINSSGFYKNVMDGKRSLGRSLIFKFTTTLHLTTKEAEYFENMIYQNDAKSAGEKEIYLQRMLELRKLNKAQNQSHQNAIETKNYFESVEELVAILTGRDEFVSQSPDLSPVLNSEQAERAAKIMEELQIILKEQSRMVYSV